MKVLLDHNIPVHIVPLLPEHQVFAARAMAWDRLTNGDLLRAAHETSFEAMITADKGIFYQQNNSARSIALVVVSTNYRPSLIQNISLIRAALSRSAPGSFERVLIPGDIRPKRTRQ